MQLIDIIEKLEEIIDDMESESDEVDALENYVKELRDVNSELFEFYKDNKLLLKSIKSRTYDIN